MATVSYPYKRIPVFPQVIAALVSGVVLLLGLVVAWTVGYQLLYAGRIFPGVSVAGVDLSGLTPSDAAVKLNQTLSYPITGKILFRDGEKVWVATPAELGMVFDPSCLYINKLQDIDISVLRELIKRSVEHLAGDGA